MMLTKNQALPKNSQKTVYLRFQLTVLSMRPLRSFVSSIKQTKIVASLWKRDDCSQISTELNSRSAYNVFSVI